MAEEAAAETAPRAPTLVQMAVSEVLQPVEHLEETTEFEKIKHKICQILQRSGKKMELNLSFVQMVDTFVEQALGSISGSFWDKEWMSEIDFVVPLTVALRERFPRFANLSHFDRAAAEACEKVLDVKRSESVIWEVAQMASDNKPVRSKLYEAVVTARKSAMPLAQRAAAGGAGPGMDVMEAFMTQWITCTVNSLKASAGGKPEKTASSETLTTLFNTVCEKGGVPRLLTNVFGNPPAEWPHVLSTIEEAYSEAAATPAGDLEEEPPAKRCRSREEGYGRLQPGAEEQKAWQYQVRHMQKWSGTFNKGNTWSKKKNSW